MEWPPLGLNQAETKHLQEKIGALSIRQIITRSLLAGVLTLGMISCSSSFSPKKTKIEAPEKTATEATQK